ncbi:sarcosine oxidase subunit gamma [Octadecabacter sp. G9-8]|uniref:Sarcosine oxidase subunit gamma n=1 Tax=Octadecabacter dasysiphoniae TaxID=2909341 RepID=A0ABS9CUN0_9RHOB|nr:sarcosine oxidase subunit gamma family protein [Octadecabacter dasysiphoniae]MCF2870457.1 sarcosine oxidase subunit gamma [Octadecabacter dasysiphoniae]
MSNLAEITRSNARGMITLRGDLTSAKMKSAVKAACGQGMPTSAQVLGDGDGGVAWMSPDELLVMVPYDDVADVIADLNSALKGEHALVADVSDARAVFSINGADAHEVLARVCPVDLHVDSFAIGQFRRTRLAQVAAAFWRHEAGFDVVCFRSVGDYVDGVLRNAAQASKVGALD